MSILVVRVCPNKNLELSERKVVDI